MPDQDTFIYWVNSYKVDCMGVGPMSCLLVRKGDAPADEWQNFYSLIQGFDYQPGYLYKLKVREIELPPGQVPADGSSIRYDLVELLEKNVDRKLRLNDIWVLEALEGEGLRDSELTGINSRPILEIHVTQSRYMGNDGCNTLNGALQKLDDTRLAFGPAAGTDMACPDMDLPEQFQEALSRVRSYRLQNLNLTLLDENGLEILRFRKTD